MITRGSRRRRNRRNATAAIEFTAVSAPLDDLAPDDDRLPAIVASRSKTLGAGRRPKFIIAAFTVSVLVAVVALQVADLWWRRERTLQAAEKRASNLAHVLTEYTRGSFAAADATLLQLAANGRRIGGAAAPNASWDTLLASARTALPVSGSLTMTDARGTIRSSTQRAIVGESQREEYIFQTLAALRRDELVVSTPYLSVTTPRRYLIPIGRRLTTERGDFDGTLVATLIPEAYREFFRTVDVGTDGIIWVFHPTGIVLFREPSASDPIGQAAAANPIVQAALQAPGGGMIQGRVGADGPVFMSAHRTLGTPPLTVAVSLSRDEILADWKDQRRSFFIGFAALTLTLALMMKVLFGQMNVRLTLEQGAKARLQAALEREQRARRETEAASDLKDEFLMTVSHELRTPLTAIYGWVRMLKKNAIPHEQRSRALAAIDRNARAQTRLIDDLLDVSRAISGKLRIDSRPCNVGEVVQAAAETVRPALEAKGITFGMSVPELEPIMADPDRLQQIVWNLLSNAAKFTPEGGTVRLDVARPDSSVEIVVSDTGIGINAAFLPHVFDRFRQSDTGTRRRFSGLGLGLAIVRHIVELHGGTVSAESAGDGQGATFRVVLPARSAPASTRPPAEDARVTTVERRARLDGVRVLIVDDEPDARELFASVLEGAGASVRVASSAAGAILVMRDEIVHVLLSDIEMPGEDGYQLLKRARAQHSSLIAIAVTGYARTVDRRQAIEAGFDAYFSKPVDPTELVEAIAGLVGPKA
jgi:signal transduction histidine kinase/CheY-like chemotaxis protein